MKEHLQKADWVQVCVGGMIGVMESSASLETTRVSDSLVSLVGGWNGVAWNARARESLAVARCAARRCE